MSRTADVGAVVGVLAVVVVYAGGPSWSAVGLPLAVAAILLGVQSLALRRSAAGVVATVAGLAALLVPVVQFAVQS